jgi:hypothetical protein
VDVLVLALLAGVLIVVGLALLSRSHLLRRSS